MPNTKQATSDLVYYFVREFIRQNGYGPTVNQIAAGVNRHPASVRYQLGQLHQEGAITWGEEAHQIDITHDGKECLRCGRELT